MCASISRRSTPTSTFRWSWPDLSAPSSQKTPSAARAGPHPHGRPAPAASSRRPRRKWPMRSRRFSTTRSRRSLRTRSTPKWPAGTSRISTHSKCCRAHIDTSRRFNHSRLSKKTDKLRIGRARRSRLAGRHAPPTRTAGAQRLPRGHDVPSLTPEGLIAQAAIRIGDSLLEPGERAAKGSRCGSQDSLRALTESGVCDRSPRKPLVYRDSENTLTRCELCTFPPPLRITGRRRETMIRTTIAATLLGITAAAFAQKPAPAPTSTSTTAATIEADSRQTREDLTEILRRYPPQVPQVLKLDPTLFANNSYMANYPALATFVTQ